jgi:hypothetical protein
MTIYSKEDVLRLIGAPEIVDEELRQCSRSAQVFSSDQPRLIDLYPKEWVAVHNGKVVAHAPDFGRVLRDLEEQKIPTTQAVIRYIDRDDHALIL